MARSMSTVPPVRNFLRKVTNSARTVNSGKRNSRFVFRLSMSMTTGAGFILYWPALCARARGMYADAGLEVELHVLSEPDAGDALASGAIPVARRGPDPHVGLIDHGAPIRLIAALVAKPPMTLFAAPDIESVAMLAGRSLAGQPTTDASSTLLRATMSAFGVMSEAYQLCDVGGAAARYTALQDGRVAAALLSPPASARALHAGFRPLVRLSDRFSYTYATMQVHQGFAAMHEAEMIAVLHVERRAVAWLYDPSNRDVAIDILADAAGLERSDASAAYAEAVLEERIYSHDLALTDEALEAVLTLLRDNGGVDALQSAGAYRDGSFVLKAFSPPA